MPFRRRAQKIAKDLARLRLSDLAPNFELNLRGRLRAGRTLVVNVAPFAWRITLGSAAISGLLYPGLSWRGQAASPPSSSGG